MLFDYTGNQLFFSFISIETKENFDAFRRKLCWSYFCLSFDIRCYNMLFIKTLARWIVLGSGVVLLWGWLKPICVRSQSSSYLTWRWSCWKGIPRAFWLAMCSPPSWIGGGLPERITVFCRASSIRLIRAARPPVVRRLSRLHKDRKSLTYSLPSSRSAGRWPGSANVEVFLFGE